MAASDYIIESRFITFTSKDEVTITFNKTHYHVPILSLLPTEDVNIKASGMTLTGATIESSGIFTGTVHMQAISKKV